MPNSDKKHRKHAKLTRPSLGHFHRNEWAIIGTPCGNIQQLAYAIIDRLSEIFNIGYVDADNANEEDFYYVFQHFNYDWTPSILAKTEYLRGIDNQRIIDYSNSFNTYEVFSHYKLTVPNSTTRGFLKSGNYRRKRALFFKSAGCHPTPGP